MRVSLRVRKNLLEDVDNALSADETALLLAELIDASNGLLDLLEGIVGADDGRPGVEFFTYFVEEKRSASFGEARESGTHRCEES